MEGMYIFAYSLMDCIHYGISGSLVWGVSC